MQAVWPVTRGGQGRRLENWRWKFVRTETAVRNWFIPIGRPVVKRPSKLRLAAMMKVIASPHLSTSATVLHREILYRKTCGLVKNSRNGKASAVFEL